MNPRGHFMSVRNLVELRIIEDFRSGRTTRAKAALLLGITEKSVSRKAKRLREEGATGLKHRNHGKAPANRSCESIRTQAIDLAITKYFDFNIAHCFDKLVAEHGLLVCYATFHAWCRKAGIKQGKRRRPSKARLYRERMANEGLMLQMDGSPHRWNGKDEWCLIGLIDDATSDMPAARFYPTETTWGCMNTLRLVIERKGVPEILYTDEAGWAGGGDKRRFFSQFVRACEELGIRVITTPSPESKGRIERAWRTIQGRLVPELRLNEIHSMIDANRYLDQVFLPSYWKERLTVTARDSTCRYQRLQPHLNLDRILCMKYWRQVRRDHTLSFEGRKFKILAPQLGSLAGKDVSVHVDEQGAITWLYGHIVLEVAVIKRPQRQWTSVAS